MQTHELIAAIEAKWGGAKVLSQIRSRHLVLDHNAEKMTLSQDELDIMGGFQRSLESFSSPYVWGLQPFADVNAASALIDVEHHRFNGKDAYTEHGFFYFPHSSIYNVEPIDRAPDQTELRAVSWMPCDAVTQQGKDGKEERVVGMAFCLWVQVGEAHGILPHFYIVCPDGQTLGDTRVFAFGRDPKNLGEQEWRNALFTVQFWVSAQHWLQQNILTATRFKTPRHERKRLQKEKKPVGDVLVVEMRRRKQTPSEPGEGTRDYSCRWIVHGHIRNQWYPSKGEHFPIPIAEHVAGPDDKPLVIKERVFNVRR